MGPAECSEQGCSEPATGSGLCKRHHRNAYMRQYSKAGASSCTVAGCVRSAYGRTGLCTMHYQRRRTLGAVGSAAPRVRKGVPWETRLWEWIDKEGPLHPVEAMGRCWLWTGRLVQGYGHYRPSPAAEGQGRNQTGVHRLVYELLVGPIPEGLTLDHVCHSLDLSCAGGDSCAHRACCNPAHLEPVTAVVNIGRGENARKVVCHRGHDLTDPANLKPNSRGARQCRACSNIARADRYRRLGR